MPATCGDYIARHNLIVNRLSQAIKLNCNLASEVHENTQVKISPKESKNNKPYHTLVRSHFGTGPTNTPKTSFRNNKELSI
jgi:hypothetical protein